MRSIFDIEFGHKHPHIPSWSPFSITNTLITSTAVKALTFQSETRKPLMAFLFHDSDSAHDSDPFIALLPPEISATTTPFCLHLPVLNRFLSFPQDSAVGTAGIVWPMATLMALYLSLTENGGFGSVVELGSGSGIVGMACALANPSARYLY